VGRVSVEGEILDSQTGETLIAVVDARVGSNAVQNVGSTWADVEDAFKLWARRLTKILRALGFEIQSETAELGTGESATEQCQHLTHAREQFLL
jgi:hypothetical protein